MTHSRYLLPSFAGRPSHGALIHQPRVDGVPGPVSHPRVRAAGTARPRRSMEETLARHTGRPDRILPSRTGAK